MSSQCLVNTPLTLLIQLPFASKSVAVAAPAPQPPLRAYPGLGLSGLPPFSSTSPLLAFPFLDGSWPHRCFLATRYLDLPALPTQRSPVLGTLGRCSPLHVPLPHTLRNGHRAAIANRLYLGHRTLTHTKGLPARGTFGGSHGAEVPLEKPPGAEGSSHRRRPPHAWPHASGTFRGASG